MREQFEKLPEIAEILSFGYHYFHETANEYNSDVEGVTTDALDLAWIVYQEQQKQIDELQKQLIDQGQRFNENTQKIADAEYKNRQLQARVDAANAVIHEYYTGSYQESPDFVVDLEQALKDGENK